MTLPINNNIQNKNMLHLCTLYCDVFPIPVQCTCTMYRYMFTCTETMIIWLLPYIYIYYCYIIVIIIVVVVGYCIIGFIVESEDREKETKKSYKTICNIVYIWPVWY